jgi:hypothetical protein
MLDEALDVADAATGVALVPGSVEFFRCCTQLYDQIAREVLGLDFPPFFAPEAHEGRLISTHDDAGVGAADKSSPASSRGVDCIAHDFAPCYGRSVKAMRLC